ncbi:DUF3168 domain-containing protein [Streptomyces fuscichromogenes]|uniref:DUF3168 domain-containing protein n=1 Tax=Streptomyces fuscichromogenes TaxID=1324013 RepID=UPI001E3526E9|nr:DUF3168 domain-containing protein [Streptomyces fuscichromogenes]
MSAPYIAMEAVQRAFYTRMAASTELMALVTGVWDQVPEGAQYPYVVLGEATETPDNAHAVIGRSTSTMLHIWSQHDGYAEALQILGVIAELFDHQPLDVPGLHHVSTHYEFSQTLTDPEPPGDIRHIPVRFRTRTEQP